MPSGACSCKVVDGNEIAASWPRNSLITVLCKGPAASGKGRGARSAANPPGTTKSLIFIYLRSQLSKYQRVRGVFIFLSGPASDKYDIVHPDHDKEKGAVQGRLPEPEAKQHTNKCQPIQILLSVPKRICNTN